MNKQTGVGLIEILIAVLVLSIGFLGMAALQAKSLSTNNSSMARSMATVASYSILDAMRADRSNALAGAYDGTVKAGPGSCPNAGTLVQTQLHDWCVELGNVLGAADTTQGIVSCNGDQCTVTVQFDDSRAGDGGATNQQVVTKAKL